MNLLFAPPEIAATACSVPSRGLEESRRPAVHVGGDDLAEPGREILDISLDYQHAYNRLDNWWIVITVALPIYTLIKSRGFSTRASVNQTESSSPLRPPPSCSRPVLSLRAAPSTGHIQRLNARGRSPAAVVATDSFSPAHGVPPGVCTTQTPFSLGRSRAKLGNAEAKSTTHPPRNLSALQLVQASPLASPRRFSTSTTTSATANIYALSPSTTIQTRFRYQSLYSASGDEHRVLLSGGQISLKAGLFGRFRGFPTPAGLEWFVLFIGVNNGRVKDPEHDLALLERMLSQSSTTPAAIHFESLSGPEATRNKIKVAFELVYLGAGRASNNSRVLVFLSGQGDEASRMCLLNEDYISENDFHSWILNIHTRSHTANIPCLIVIDICRLGRHTTKPDTSANYLWSCSPGQLAHVLAFPSESVPWSCFLLAFFLTSYDLYGPAPLGPMSFEEAFKRRTEQLGALVLCVHDRRHRKENGCEQCATQVQTCDPPEKQSPEGDPSAWDILGGFGESIMVAHPESVRYIADDLNRRMYAFGVLTKNTVPHAPSNLSKEVVVNQQVIASERRFHKTQPVLCAEI